MRLIIQLFLDLHSSLDGFLTNKQQIAFVDDLDLHSSLDGFLTL